MWLLDLKMQMQEAKKPSLQQQEGVLKWGLNERVIMRWADEEECSK